MNALLTLTAAWCLGWIGHYRSIDQRAQLAWIAMTFCGTAAVFLLNTKAGNWSAFDWIVALYGAGVTASMFVEKLLEQQTLARDKSASREAHPPIESNGAQA